MTSIPLNIDYIFSYEPIFAIVIPTPSSHTMFRVVPKIPRARGGPHTFRRGFKLGALGMAAIKGWGPIINVVGGAYIGGLIVCGGLLYLMYHDADLRQHIPFELKLNDQIESVKAINKDDVCGSPRHAAKHYRKVLMDLAKQNDPSIESDKDEKSYLVPLLDADVLVNQKLPEFSNFYIDMVLRYTKALLAKGELDALLSMLQQVITNDEMFYKLGDAERLSQCARLLCRLEANVEDKVGVLTRDLDMLQSTYARVNISNNMILEDSKITDEVLTCLDELAFWTAKLGGKVNLDKLLNIYLANLKKLSDIRDGIANGTVSQALYPMFDCSEKNLLLRINETKAHISEVMWAKGFRKNATAWGEDVVNDLFPYHNNMSEVGPILVQVLNNLDAMYKKLGDRTSVNRCGRAKKEVSIFEGEEPGWYDGFINRFSRIMWHKGPLGIIEKPLLERFGPPQPLPHLEEIEGEDDE